VNAVEGKVLPGEDEVEDVGELVVTPAISAS